MKDIFWGFLIAAIVFVPTVLYLDQSVEIIRLERALQKCEEDHQNVSDKEVEEEDKEAV